MENTLKQGRTLGEFRTELVLKPHSTLKKVNFIPQRTEEKPKEKRKDEDMRGLLGQNTEDYAYNGYLSAASTRVIKKRLNVLLTSIQLNADLKALPLEVNHNQPYPTFVTLNLPCKQVHSDQRIKNEVFDKFREWLMKPSTEVYKNGKFKGQPKSFGVKCYLWRAETQKNGNLHFHIVIDRFVPWDRIREQWNKCCEYLGYMTMYRNWKNFEYRDGFYCTRAEKAEYIKKLKKWVGLTQETGVIPERTRPEFVPYLQDFVKTKKKISERTLDKVAYTILENNYKEGVRCNWSNPNSTDIHAIRNMNSVCAYVTKYVTKEPKEVAPKLAANQEIKEFEEKYMTTSRKTGEVVELTRKVKYIVNYHIETDWNGEQVKFELSREKYVPKFIERKIRGNIWGCSDTLRDNPSENWKFDYPKENVSAAKIVKYEYLLSKEDKAKETTSEHETFTYNFKDKVTFKNYLFNYPLANQYLSTIETLIPPEEIEASNAKMDEFFTRSGSKVIPLVSEHLKEPLGMGKRGDKKRLSIRQDQFLKQFHPEIYQNYLNHYRNIYTKLYG